MTQGERQNTLLITLLAGAAGAGIGLLFAPRSGKETRQQMREAALEAKRSAGEGLDSAREHLDEQLDKVRGAKNKLSDTIRKNRRSDKQRDDTLESPIITAWNEEV